MYAKPSISGIMIECTKKRVKLLFGENNKSNQKGITPQLEKRNIFSKVKYSSKLFII